MRFTLVVDTTSEGTSTGYEIAGIIRRVAVHVEESYSSITEEQGDVFTVDGRAAGRWSIGFVTPDDTAENAVSSAEEIDAVVA